MKKKNILLELVGLLAIIATALVVCNVINPLFAIPGMALAMNPFYVYQTSKVIQGAIAAQKIGQPLEIQHQPLYSFVTLPAALNAAGGINFFADASATVGLQRTNLTRPNQVPPGTNFEMHGVRIIFAAPFTVLFTSFNTAVRDAYLILTVGTSQRLTLQLLRNFLPSTIYAPSESAAAGDNAILTEQGYTADIQLFAPIVIQNQTNFGINIVFATDVAALGNTVMGVQLEGILDRGNIKLDQSPTRPVSTLM